MEEDKAVNCQLKFNMIHVLIKVCPGHYGNTKEVDLRLAGSKESFPEE